MRTTDLNKCYYRKDGTGVNMRAERYRRAALVQVEHVRGTVRLCVCLPGIVAGCHVDTGQVAAARVEELPGVSRDDVVVLITSENLDRAFAGVAWVHELRDVIAAFSLTHASEVPQQQLARNPASPDLAAEAFETLFSNAFQ